MPIYHRRDFLKIGLGILAGSALPLDALAAALKRIDAPRALAFYNIHTDERIELCYFDQGAYCPQALEQINYILRDFRTGEVTPIDTDLLDLLYAVKCRIHPRDSFSVISGYRSPETNEKLRRHTRGVAKKSFHTRGKAIDIRIPGYDTARLRNLCVRIKAGGVGYYPKSDFVHLDVGPVRAW